MVFSSLVFLCIFLPAAVVLYSVCRNITYKNIILLAVSLAFYAWGEPKWILVMILTSLIDFAAGLLIDKNRGKKTAKVFLSFSIILTLGILIVFKYLNFITHNLNLLPFLTVRQTNIALPIGISFYTFQAMSYVIDVYRGDAKVQKRYYKLLLYISMFPQLIAGPIVRYTDISEAIDSRHVSFEDFSTGVTRLVTGLGKKVILANFLGKIVSDTLGGDLSVLSFAGSWTGLLAYFFQIYFDFSGYSDMAIGMGNMFGFSFAENFNYPYVSRSITEFWRRWHISLGSFFRDYVYIPLGGNRRFQLRNMLVVWLLTGIWHGASWNFLLWGLYYFMILAMEKYVYGGALKKIPKIAGHIYALFIVIIGWVFFYFEDMGSIAAMFKALFGFGAAGVASASDLTVIKNNILLFVLAAVASLPVGQAVKKLRDRLSRSAGGTIVTQFVTLGYQAAMLFISVSCLVGSTYNPFLYFRF